MPIRLAPFWLTLLLSCQVSAGFPEAGPDKDNLPITPGECIDQTLSPSDSILQDTQTYTDIYTFFWPGSPLRITMDSPDFDESLQIFAASANSITIDQSTTEPEVFEMTSPPGGTYTVYATERTERTLDMRRTHLLFAAAIFITGFAYAQIIDVDGDKEVGPGEAIELSTLRKQAETEARAIVLPLYQYLALQGFGGFSGIGFILAMAFRMRTFLSKRVGAAWLLGAMIWNCNPFREAFWPGPGSTCAQTILQGSYWPHFSLVCSIILFYVAAGYMLKSSHPLKERSAAQLSEEMK